MSGTSVDGIDIACMDLELDGDELGCEYRGVLSVPFDAALRDRIVAALPPASLARASFASCTRSSATPTPTRSPRRSAG